MSEITPKPAAPAASRWMKIALVVSLGINLAILGMVGGAVIKGGHDHPAPLVRDLGFGPFSEALSREDRDALRRAFRSETGGLRLVGREMRAEFTELMRILRTEPFDQAGLDAVFDSMQARGRERLDLGQRLLSERISTMTPEARRQFADRLQDVLGRRTDRKAAPKADDG